MMKQLLHIDSKSNEFFFSSSESIISLEDENEDDCFDILLPIQKP